MQETGKEGLGQRTSLGCGSAPSEPEPDHEVSRSSKCGLRIGTHLHRIIHVEALLEMSVLPEVMTET